MYVEYSLQNGFIFFISLFGLSAILKIRNGKHVHYVGLVVAYTWNREKQMFVALGKEFDMSISKGEVCDAAAASTDSTIHTRLPLSSFLQLSILAFRPKFFRH